MKKIILSIAAVAALAACTKSEVQYEQTGEIGFLPVAKKATKVAEDDAIYNTELDMYIFANTYTDADETSFTLPYFANAKFEHRDAGIFGGADAVYYWPNVKTLKFAGLSASGNVNNGATPELTADLKIELNGYAPGTGGAEEGDNDLMWFPTTQAYGKSDVPGTGDTAPTDDNIEVVMQHACAWVTINIKGNGITGGTKPWTITNVSFNDLSQSGNVLLGTTANWTSVATGTPCTVFAGTKPLETNVANFTQIGNFKDLIVVPQTTKKLYVTYEYDSDPNSDTIPTFSETKEIELTYGTSGDTWYAGIHYIYNITIGTKEILVEPTVTTWEDPATVENIEF